MYPQDPHHQNPQPYAPQAPQPAYAPPPPQPQVYPPQYTQPVQQHTVYATPQSQYPAQPVYSVQPQMTQIGVGVVPATTTNVVVVSQTVSRPPKDWNHSVFDCTSDCGTCLVACVCPGLVYGMNKKDLSHRSSFVGDCIMYYLSSLVGMHSCVGGGGRTTIRAKYNIRGDSCADCCCHLLCTPCALTQERMEINEMMAAGLN